jgi:hypothetical protein
MDDLMAALAVKTTICQPQQPETTPSSIYGDVVDAQETFTVQL